MTFNFPRFFPSCRSLETFRKMNETIILQEDQISDLEETNKSLVQSLGAGFENEVTMAGMLGVAARDFGIVASCAADVIDTIDGITTPNGTLRKIYRITNVAMDSCAAVVSPDMRKQIADMLVAEEESAKVESENLKAESIEDDVTVSEDAVEQAAG